MRQPPSCPDPRCNGAVLWKDTSTTATGEDHWFWWCGSCKRKWKPTSEQLEAFRYGPSGRRSHRLH
ncbi:hypothetical protein FNJ62_21760 [Streptomyces benahoarensis]|uniref:Uncharacterized protein n=1 Tax=Streptomyces benahoarensis TaxID=2595054 RepID=A0A553Z9M1_9ACTN|nr:hypothetical protein FNJ62_21760 [Streptomyces benahoarensis]TSB38136.1 hypothetical protein FNZ23_17525 [Streptomyces benahoarensis]